MKSTENMMTSSLDKANLIEKIDDTLEEIGISGPEIREKASEYYSQAQAKLGDVNQKLGEIGKKLESEIQKSPIRMAAIGALALVGIAFLLKRRFRQ